jgi:hypothetical protein
VGWYKLDHYQDREKQYGITTVPDSGNFFRANSGFFMADLILKELLFIK